MALLRNLLEVGAGSGRRPRKERAMSGQPGRRLVQPEEVPTSIFDWGMIKFLSEPSLTNAEHLTVGLVRLDPGQGHLRHNHPGSEEILFILSGEGEQMVETDLEERGGVPRHFPVRAHSLVHIPASVYHQTVNTGPEPLFLLAVYSPCGPEDVVRALPDCRSAPPGRWPE
jgi:oxalate decarboxylase/phosphoglucose isomerase-like protein (cupin superfamily)